MRSEQFGRAPGPVARPTVGCKDNRAGSVTVPDGRPFITLRMEPLAKLPGDWDWAQSSALLVNTIALDRRLDILSGEPAARQR